MRRKELLNLTLEHTNMAVELLPNTVLIGYEGDYRELERYLVEENTSLFVRNACLYIVEGWRKQPFSMTYLLKPHDSNTAYLLALIEVSYKADRLVPIAQFEVTGG